MRPESTSASSRTHSASTYGAPERIRETLVAVGERAKSAVCVIDRAIFKPVAERVARAMPNSPLTYATGVVVPAVGFWGAVWAGSAWAAIPAAYLIGLGARIALESYETERYWPASKS